MKPGRIPFSWECCTPGWSELRPGNASDRSALTECGEQLPELTPLRYNQKASLINPGFVVVGDTTFGWPERLRGD